MAKITYMKTAAVICELNPLHNGHAYLARALKERTGAGRTVAVMSGNYVQRGAPACFDKYLRTRAALLSGFDLVLELPPVFALSSAGDFAAAGVRAASLLGASYLGFGIGAPAASGSSAPAEETARTEDVLFRAAEALSGKDDSEDPALREALRAGLPYPAAREKLLEEAGLSGEELSLLRSPNNILALEYLLSIRRLAPSLAPAMFSRLGDAYGADRPSDPHYTSATALRERMAQLLPGFPPKGGPEALSCSDYIPAGAAALFEEALRNGQFLTQDDFSSVLSYRLLRAKAEGEDLSVYADCGAGLSERILAGASLPLSLTGRISSLKTRAFTWTRISRALMHIALGIREEDVKAQKDSGYVSYLRILGFREDASDLLAAIKKSSPVPLVSNAAKEKELLSDTLFHDDLYYAVLASKSRVPVKNELQRQIVIV